MVPGRGNWPVIGRMMIDRMDGGTTWYETTADRGPARPALAGAVTADVCVIGGGLAGLTTALELARRGRDVVLLEAQRLAWGASGRNGGVVSGGFAQALAKVEERVGGQAAAALYGLSRQGMEFVRSEIASGEPAIRMGEGRLSCQRYDDAPGKRAEIASAARWSGREERFLETHETRALVESERYFQSSLDVDAFHVHPLRYALLIAAKAETAGARLYESSAVRLVSRARPGFAVETAGGTVTAGQVVYCLSALDRALHPMTGRAVLPVATYVAVTEPLRQNLIRTPHAVSDIRRAGNYFRLIDDGRLLWGGAITTRVSAPIDLAARMKADMLSVFPTLASSVIDHAWIGLMGYARHFMPLIGTDGDGQWWATAFGGHGMNTTAMGGLLLARAIAAGDDEYRRFAPFPPEWAGGPLGRAAVQLGYWGLQARDWLEERRWLRAGR
jgi:gamma-glutamylputrescine oxidase